MVIFLKKRARLVVEIAPISYQLQITSAGLRRVDKAEPLFNISITGAASESKQTRNVQKKVMCSILVSKSIQILDEMVYEDGRLVILCCVL